jgi:hypothetical protein
MEVVIRDMRSPKASPAYAETPNEGSKKVMPQQNCAKIATGRAALGEYYQPLLNNRATDRIVLSQKQARIGPRR